MSDVRAFQPDDIDEVADLYADVFLHDQDIDHPDLRAHFREVYFDNPFSDDDCPSFVHRDRNGVVTAFLGVMPRPMRLKDGSVIQAAIGGNLMVKGEKVGAPADERPPPTHGNQLAPLALMRAFFGTPRDLHLADTAIDPSRRIWERCGGHALRLYSLRWLRVLRPFGLGLNSLERRGHARPLLRLAAPFAKLFDGAIGRFSAPEAASLPAGCVIETMEAEDAIRRLDACRLYDLMPAYTPGDLSWLLEKANARRHYGELRALTVRETGGKALGHVVYTAIQGGIGQVLHLKAEPKTVDRVFDALFHDAAAKGVAALGGKVDPMVVDHLSKRRCMMTFNSWTLIRTQSPALLQTFLEGKAFFSELESEGWTRFLQARDHHEFRGRRPQG